MATPAISHVRNDNPDYSMVLTATGGSDGNINIPSKTTVNANMYEIPHYFGGNTFKNHHIAVNFYDGPTWIEDMISFIWYYG